jgi:type I restriction enzyme S subunit
VYFPFFKGNAEYLMRIFESGAMFSGLGKLGTQLNLNTDTVGAIQVAWPPADEQTAIVEYLDAQTAKIDTAIAAARREIELLCEYRTRLIADVVTGKLDVREVAARLPEEPPEEKAELMDTDEIAEGEATNDDAAAEALSEEEVEP